jgi:hypothetical protein
VDIRLGLPQNVLDDLRRAQRISLAVKNTQSGLLGYWIDDELHIALLESEPLWELRYPQLGTLTEGQGEGQAPIVRGASAVQLKGVILDIPEAQLSDTWSRLLGLVRVGDVLRLGMDAGTPGRVVMKVRANRALVGEVVLMAPGRAQPRSAAA